MRRKLLRLRPYLIAAAVGTILTIDLSNQWEVPIAQLPGEIAERYFDKVDADNKPEKLKALADAGNVQAQYLYALRHTRYSSAKLIIKLDKDIAFTYMKKAAEHRHPRAMAVLSLYYLKGLGTNKDDPRAKEWADRAVAKAQPIGYRVLGELTLEEAERIRPVSEKSPRSDYNQKLRDAYEHIRHGANLGDRGCFRLLGLGYEKGAPDMPISYRLALEYFERAAYKRDIESARLLVERHEAGLTTPRNEKLAYAWQMVVVEIEDKDADRLKLRAMEQGMSAIDIQTAQETGAKFIKSLASEAADALSRLNIGR